MGVSLNRLVCETVELLKTLVTRRGTRFDLQLGADLPDVLVESKHVHDAETFSHDEDRAIGVAPGLVIVSAERLPGGRVVGGPLDRECGRWLAGESPPDRDVGDIEHGGAAGPEAPTERQSEILGTNAGFGGEKLAAPQASLMAVVTRGIVEAQAELILILTGVLFGIALILMQVKSPMLISVGMYLPIDTTFAIFVGGLMKGLLDKMLAKKKIEGPAKEKIDNIGILLASGLIAGEALLGLLFAGLAFAEIKIFHVFENPTYLLSLAAIAIIALVLVRVPLSETKKG